MRTYRQGYHCFASIKGGKIMEQEKNLHLVKHGLRFLESTHTYSSDRKNTRFMAYLPN